MEIIVLATLLVLTTFLLSLFVYYKNNTDRRTITIEEIEYNESRQQIFRAVHSRRIPTTMTNFAPNPTLDRHHR